MNTKSYYQTRVKKLFLFFFLSIFFISAIFSNLIKTLPENSPQGLILSKDYILRLVRGEAKTGYTLWKPLVPEFIENVIRQIKEQEIIPDELLEEFVSKFRIGRVGKKPLIDKSTLKVGIILRTMQKMMEETGLENLDLKDWFEDYSQLLTNLFPDIRTKLGSVELALIDRAITELQEEHLDIFNQTKNFIRRLYIIDFFQRTGFLEVEEHSLAELEDEIVYNILDVLAFKPIRPEVLEADIIPKQPGTFIMGRTTPEVYEDFKHRYLLQELIKNELSAFAERYIREVVLDAQVAQIKIEVSELAWNDIKEVERQLEDYGYGEFLKFMTDEEKETVLMEVRITQFLNSSGEISNFTQDNLNNIQRLAQFVLELEWQKEGKTTSLLDYLTVAEAEDVVRSVIKVYIFKKIKDVAPLEEIELQAESVREMIRYNFYRYKNKNNNRNTTMELRQTFKELEQIDYKENREHWERFQLRYLLKKIITAGHFDLGLAEMRKEFEKTTAYGLKELSSVEERPIVIDSFYKFYKENIKDKPAVRFMFEIDNHGQIMYVLGISKLILELNPNAQVVIIPKAVPIGDDVAHQDLIDILETDKKSSNPLFWELRRTWGKRFVVVKNGSYIQGEDFRHMSDESLKFFTDLEYKGRKFDKIVVVNVGNAHLFTQLSTRFTKPLSENIEFYFAYRVKNPTAQAITGISMEDKLLIFAHVEPGGWDEKGNVVGLGSPVEEFTDSRTGERIDVVAYTILEYAKRNGYYPYDYIILEDYR